MLKHPLNKSNKLYHILFLSSITCFSPFSSLNHSESDSTHCNPQPPQPSFQCNPSYAMSKTIWCQKSLCSMGAGNGGTLSGGPAVGGPAVSEPSKRMGPTAPCSDLTAGSFGILGGLEPTWFLNCEMCSLENQPRCSMSFNASMQRLLQLNPCRSHRRRSSNLFLTRHLPSSVACCNLDKSVFFFTTSNDWGWLHLSHIYIYI